MVRKGINLQIIKEKMKKIIIYTLLAALFFAMGCEKKEDKTINHEAKIIYEGAPSVDGCGYFLLIKGTKYKALELTEEFLLDGLIVNVDYQLLDTKWQYNWQESKYDQIKIINISKK